MRADRGGSQAVGHALDVQSGISEVKQQASRQVCRLEMVDALGAVRRL
jgi:hypothetical protein